MTPVLGPDIPTDQGLGLLQNADDLFFRKPTLAALILLGRGWQEYLDQIPGVTSVTSATIGAAADIINDLIIAIITGR